LSRKPPSSRSRRESKELTRQALLRAALKLLSRNSFDSISLREVTREAGITPTAFYRHFDDMEELGLVLVDESFASLRLLLRTARTDPTVSVNIRRSTSALAAHVREHEGHTRFIVRERYGGVRRLRRAIQRELDLVADELAFDLARAPLIATWSREDRRLLAGLIIDVMVDVVAELVEANTDAAGEAVMAEADRKLLLLLIGVTHWRSDVGGDGDAPTAPTRPARS
jgi:AcrR family transcriptional regulator